MCFRSQSHETNGSTDRSCEMTEINQDRQHKPSSPVRLASFRIQCQDRIESVGKRQVEYWPFWRAPHSGSIRLSRILAKLSNGGLDEALRRVMVLRVSTLVSCASSAYRRIAPRPSDQQTRRQSTGTDGTGSHSKQDEGNSKERDLSAQPFACENHSRGLAAEDSGGCRHQDDI